MTGNNPEKPKQIHDQQHQSPVFGQPKQVFNTAQYYNQQQQHKNTQEQAFQQAIGVITPYKSMDFWY